MSGRTRPLNRIRLGDHLVVDAYGTERYASEVVRGKYGSQKGAVIHPDDLDEPGRFDLQRERRQEKQLPWPVTGKQRQTWVRLDKDGNPV